MDVILNGGSSYEIHSEACPPQKYPNTRSRGAGASRTRGTTRGRPRRVRESNIPNTPSQSTNIPNTPSQSTTNQNENQLLLNVWDGSYNSASHLNTNSRAMNNLPNQIWEQSNSNSITSNTLQNQIWEQSNNIPNQIWEQSNTNNINPNNITNQIWEQSTRNNITPNNPPSQIWEQSTINNITRNKPPNQIWEQSNINNITPNNPTNQIWEQSNINNITPNNPTNQIWDQSSRNNITPNNPTNQIWDQSSRNNITPNNPTNQIWEQSSRNNVTPNNPTNQIWEQSNTNDLLNTNRLYNSISYNNPTNQNWEPCNLHLNSNNLQPNTSNQTSTNSNNLSNQIWEQSNLFNATWLNSLQNSEYLDSRNFNENNANNAAWNNNISVWNNNRNENNLSQNFPNQFNHNEFQLQVQRPQQTWVNMVNESSGVGYNPIAWENSNTPSNARELFRAPPVYTTVRRREPQPPRRSESSRTDSSRATFHREGTPFPQSRPFRREGTPTPWTKNAPAYSHRDEIRHRHTVKVPSSSFTLPEVPKRLKRPPVPSTPRPMQPPVLTQYQTQPSLSSYPTRHSMNTQCSRLNTAGRSSLGETNQYRQQTIRPDAATSGQDRTFKSSPTPGPSQTFRNTFRAPVKAEPWDIFGTTPATPGSSSLTYITPATPGGSQIFSTCPALHQQLVSSPADPNVVENAYRAEVISNLKKISADQDLTNCETCSVDLECDHLQNCTKHLSATFCDACHTTLATYKHVKTCTDRTCDRVYCRALKRLFARERDKHGVKQGVKKEEEEKVQLTYVWETRQLDNMYISESLSDLTPEDLQSHMMYDFSA